MQTEILPEEYQLRHEIIIIVAEMQLKKQQDKLDAKRQKKLINFCQMTEKSSVQSEIKLLGTHDIQAACTSQTAQAPRGTPQDLTSASSVAFAFPAHMSHYIHSRQTRVTACRGGYLKTHNICAESSLLC